MESNSKEKRIGHESLSAFVKVSAKVIQENQFDHIFAASDSGQLAAHILGLVYDELHIDRPPVVALPIFRHVDKERTVEFDNSVSSTQNQNLRSLRMGRCLFIDDEIWRGVTLRGFMDVLDSVGSLPESSTIVAEDGGFECPETMHGVPMRFISIKWRVPTVYNSFSHTIPDRFTRSLSAVEFANDKQRMCALLGLPVKQWNDGVPAFSYVLLERSIKNVPNFSELQQGYEKWLLAMVKDSLV